MKPPFDAMRTPRSRRNPAKFDLDGLRLRDEITRDGQVAVEDAAQRVPGEILEPGIDDQVVLT